MSRHKNIIWNSPDKDLSWQHVYISLLMDLRDELQMLNRRMTCHETLSIPSLLRSIKWNTTKKRRKAKL